MQTHFRIFITLLLLTGLFSCQDKDVKSFTNVHFELQFSPSQVRLNNLGEPAEILPGNAAQTPLMNSMSVHYIELSQDEFTPYKSGNVVYKAPETMDGGQQSIDFDSAIVVAEAVDFYHFNIAKLLPGTYNYVRVSVAYQNYSVQFNLLNIPVAGDLFDQQGTVASFLGFRTYIRKLQVMDLSTDIYADKEQGFWAFETGFDPPFDPYNAIYSGQAPAGATTVVNPIAATSPVPAGSCVVTGKLSQPLIITGDESDDAAIEDLYITLSFSINQSFEWNDSNGNGAWDIDASTSIAEKVIDMGIRGLEPTYEWRTP